MWPKTRIRTVDGWRDAVAPTVISASRRTDIPAYYPQWLANRLRAGYIAWTNPYSGAVQYVSLERTRVIVFWTKNPRPLIPLLPLLERSGIGFYVQYTLNDYGPEGLEPGLPPLSARVATFRELAGLLGPERVVWRFDPLLLARGLEPDALLERVRRLADVLDGCTGKLVFSFAEVAGYAKVRRRFAAEGVSWRDFTGAEMLWLAAGLRETAEARGMETAACAQSVDLSPVGVGRNACVDPALLQAAEAHAAPAGTRGSRSLPGTNAETGLPRGKDPGQRDHCGCAPSKDIGQYDTCGHGCLYCYATASPRQAREIAVRSDPGSESVAGDPGWARPRKGQR
jgi:hypothetical protein